MTSASEDEIRIIVKELDGKYSVEGEMPDAIRTYAHNRVFVIHNGRRIFVLTKPTRPMSVPAALFTAAHHRCSAVVTILPPAGNNDGPAVYDLDERGKKLAVDVITAIKRSWQTASRGERTIII